MTISFCELHKTIKQHLKEINIKDYIKRKRYYKTKLNFSLMITLILWFYHLKMFDFKAYYERFLMIYFKHLGLICYKRFMYWKAQLSNTIEHILKQITAHNLKQKSKYLMIDSSALKVCEKHKTKKHKVFKKFASKSFTSTGEFYGFKIHLLINNLKHIIDYGFTTGKIHDLKALQELALLKNKNKKLVLGDSGYVSKSYQQELKNKQSIYFLVKPRNNQEKRITNNQKRFLWNRWNIESVLSLLKKGYGLNYNQARTYQSLHCHWICSLLAYELFS